MLVAALLGGALVGLGGCPPQAPVRDFSKLNADIQAQMSRVGLGPGDVFQVSVYGEKGLSGVHRVGPDGTIDFPLVGRVQVADKNPAEIAATLRARLQDGFLRDPYVSVFVKEYNSKKIFVLGEVARPGTFPYSDGMNVVEAITLAGGFRNTANENYVVVTRREGGKETRIPVPVGKISEEGAPNLELRPGDIVFVPDRLL